MVWMIRRVRSIKVVEEWILRWMKAILAAGTLEWMKMAVGLRMRLRDDLKWM